jgi:hypothetical protein
LNRKPRLTVISFTGRPFWPFPEQRFSMFDMFQWPSIRWTLPWVV